MNKQEIFTKVATHLLTQNARSFGPKTGQCAYRGADDRMCAAGVLIPDDLYHAGLEQRSVMHQPVVAALIAAGVVPPTELEALAFDDGGGFARQVEFLSESGQAPTLLFLRELQLIHDSHEVEEWRCELGMLAITHDLTMPEGV